MIIRAKIKPASSKDEIKRIDELTFEIRVIDQPEKGRANEKVIKLLSEYFGIPKSKIKIVKGLGSRYKEILLGD